MYEQLCINYHSELEKNDVFLIVFAYIHYF